MEGSKLEKGSSPPAGSEDIQKRLVRPTPLHSQHSSSCAASLRCNEISRRNSSKLDLSSQLQKKSKAVKKIKRLEDYLDPDLLSTIRAKRKNFVVEMKKITKHEQNESITKREQNESDWLEWPGDHHELMASIGSSRRFQSSGVKHEENDILDLKLDSDSARDGPDEIEEFYCTPFQRFEKAAMKQFKP